MANSTRLLLLLLLGLGLGFAAPSDTGRAAASDTEIGVCRAALAGGFRSNTLVLHAVGDAAAPTDRALPVEDCPALVGEADAPWLDVVPSRAGLTLRLRPEAVPAATGRYTSPLRLRTRREGRPVLARNVTLRRLARTADGAVRRVLVVGVDGVRSDALAVAHTPVWDALARHAAWTDEASTQLTAETSSSPGWVSVLTGVEPTKHRVASNRYEGIPDRAYPTFLWRARHRLGLRTAAAVGWEPLSDRFVEPDALDAVHLADLRHATRWMGDLLSAGEHDVHFVHLDDPDAAGHGHGFSPEVPEYLAAIERADAAIGRLLDVLLSRPGVAGEEWLVAITTDHGGEGLSHGSFASVCRTIPLVLSGASVRPVRLPDGLATHMDLHPTLLTFLGLPPAPWWGLDGRAWGIAPVPAA